MTDKVEYVLGRVEPDPIGQLLKSGFDRFTSPTGIEGLAKFSDDRLDLLALLAPHPGQGAFRALIVRAKSEYKTICVWEIWSPWLTGVLERYGFKPTTEFADGGWKHEGMRWDKPVCATERE